jgi:hypothetical protein|tara:strand:+ start:285 stop:683 length:399 start_codon:yes stop_codon:yes gene_type:complete
VVDLGHWEGVLEENIDLPYGFIYKITNLTNDKKYIGKKQCQSIRKRPPLKGKKNKRHEKIETDWKTYTSSSNELNKDLEELGKDKFKFEILRWCDSKWELSYYEARLQFNEEVLLRDDYYNGIINVRIGGRK